MVIYGEVVGFDTGSPFFDVDLTKLRTIDPVENLTSVNVSAAASYQAIQDAVKTGRPVRLLFQYKDQKNWTVGVHLSAVHVPDDLERDTLVLSGLCGSSIRGAATSQIQLQIRDDGVFLDYYADIADDGVKVTSVNGEIPDENGNVNIPIPASTVTSVNGEMPDKEGNVTLTPDDTLSVEGAFADAKAVGAQLTQNTQDIAALGDEVDASPVSVSEDGYTDIAGQRQATNIQFVRTENNIAIDITMQGAVSYNGNLELDEKGFPARYTENGLEVSMGFTGFDDLLTTLWEGGSY